MSNTPPTVTYSGALMLCGAYAGCGDMGDLHRVIGLKLLPPGQAFPRNVGTSLDELVFAMSLEYALADAFLWQVNREQDPRWTTYLIDEWEYAVGLPDCNAASTNISDRRGAVHAKYAAQYIVSIQDYIDFASRMGYTMTVTEGYADVFRCGVGRCGEAIGGRNVAYSWTMTGASGNNDNLLACLLQKLKPANTQLTVVFT